MLKVGQNHLTMVQHVVLIQLKGAQHQVLASDLVLARKFLHTYTCTRQGCFQIPNTFCFDLGMVLSSRFGYTFCTLSRRIHMQSCDSSRPVPAKIHKFLRGFLESEKPSYLRRSPKHTSLKSGAFGSHHGESLYLLVVEVVIIILSPNKQWH